MLKRTLVATLIVAFVVPLLAASATAGRSAIWVDQSSYRTDDGALHYGQEVSFGYRTDYYDASGGTGPWLHLHCFRNGNLIYADSRAGFPGGKGFGAPFNLGPSAAWSGGEADCTGILGHRTRSGKFRTDATTEFHVSA